MATQTPAPPRNNAKPLLVFPLLHEDVANALPPNLTYTWVGKRSRTRRVTKEWSTSVMGRFKCTKPKCGAQWTSGKIAIQIKGYTDNGYNATIFNQRCNSCKALGELDLDEGSYVERVARRLQIWAGIKLEPAVYNDKKTKPHRSNLCEGCKRGVCREGRD